MEFPANEPYEGEIGNFVDAITTHRAPEVDGREGLRKVELLTEAVARAGS